MASKRRPSAADAAASALAAAEAPPQRKDGDESGHPEVRLDLECRRLYTLDSLGRRQYQECPAGFTYDDTGRLQKLPEPAAE